MNMSEKLKKAKDSVLQKLIDGKKTSKVLSLLKKDILEMSSDGIALTEQREILEEALNMSIKEGTYKSFYYRHIKKKTDANETVLPSENEAKKSVSNTKNDNKNPLKKENETDTKTDTLLESDEYKQMLEVANGYTLQSELQNK